MKKFLKLAAFAALVAAFASCEPGTNDPVNNENGKDPVVQEPTYSENLAFTLEVTEVDTDKAKVKVSHNGTDTDTWYAFATTETNVENAVKEEVAKLVANNNIPVKKQKEATVTVKDLTPETDYTFIVFGLTAKGEVYGTAAHTTFKTEAEAAGFTVNEAWTVEYSGAGVIEEEEFEHIISVTSTDENYYFITVFSEADYAEFGAEAIAAFQYEELLEMIGIFNDAYGMELTILDLSYNTSSAEPFDLEAGEWRAFAIGVTPEGQLSGLYAVSDLITIVEPDPTEGYASWLGNWTLTGANGLTQEVTFSKDRVNKTYVMTGYEGEEAEGIEVIVDWIEEQQCWMIVNQFVGTYSFGNAGNGDIWFMGNDAEGQFYPMEDIPICVGGEAEDGSLVAIGYTEEETDEETGETFSYIVDTMGFSADIGGKWYYISSIYEVGYPTFPMTITPSAAAASTLSVEKSKKNVRIFTPANRTFKAYAAK